MCTIRFLLVPCLPYLLSHCTSYSRWGHTPLMAALTMNQTATVKVLNQGAARLMALGTTRSFVSSKTWNPSDQASGTAQAAGLNQQKIAQCQAM